MHMVIAAAVSGLEHTIQVDDPVLVPPAHTPNLRSAQRPGSKVTAVVRR